MNILGVDYGLKKIGLAMSYGSLAEPYKVVKSIDEILEICSQEKIEKVIVGISEGETAKKTKEFIESLKVKIDLPITEFDETLSTYDAQRLSIESGIKRSKRKSMEDAYAATIMLQNYIDINGD